MSTFNGFADDEARSVKHRARKADYGHSVVETVTRRRGSAFVFRYTVVCQCGWTASSRSSVAAVGYRHAAHMNKLSDVELSRCEWFAACDRPATHDETHPILGTVPACDRCVTIGL